MKPAIVDYMDPEFGRKFSESMRDTGFGIITNHLIPAGLIQRVFQEWEDFFALTEGKKNEYLRPDDESQYGYYPLGSENAKDSKVKDLKEFFQIYLDKGNMQTDPRFEATMDLRALLDAVGQRLLDKLEMNGPMNNADYPYFKDLSQMAHGSNQTMMRAIHYPPIEGEVEPGAMRAAAHGDINLITLLVAGTQPGLQVQDNAGNWHDVSCDPGSIAVNVGDMLQECSNGYYKSTIHRVVNPQGQPNVSRYSIPLFIHPRPEVRLSDRHTQESYLDERLREIGLRPKKGAAA